jgi:hypothetical protein
MAAIYGNTNKQVKYSIEMKQSLWEIVIHVLLHILRKTGRNAVLDLFKGF